MEHLDGNTVLLKRMGIDTHVATDVTIGPAYRQPVRSEGFSAHSRVMITTERASIIATLNVVRDGFVLATEAGLSDAAWQLAGCSYKEYGALHGAGSGGSCGLMVMTGIRLAPQAR
jgi:hypothetical protein